MAKRLTAREKRLAEHDARVATRIPKHKNWGNLICVTGWVDSHGAIHAKATFQPDYAVAHGELFPNCNRYKLWRWWKGKGLEESSLTLTGLDAEDYVKINDWLYKHGFLNDWEL